MITKIKTNPIILKKGLVENRYIIPKKVKDLAPIFIKYKHAEEMAREIVLEKNCRMFCIVNGTFIFGDLIEALCVEHNLHVKTMTIATLSFKADNVDSLANLLNGGYVDELNLLVSVSFESQERFNLLKYAWQELDKDNRFQLAIAGTHLKMCLMELHTGEKIVMHGSVNLRSSDNIEQFVIEECPELYDFNMDYISPIIERYKTVKKAVRNKQLWDIVNIENAFENGDRKEN